MSTTESSTNAAEVTTVIGKFEGATAKVVAPKHKPLRAYVGYESTGQFTAHLNGISRAQAQALADALQAILDETGPR